jgi:methylamine---glutamate N-methyltransferase subunit C
MKYECEVCGHKVPKHEFEGFDLSWECPTCNSDRSYFKLQSSNEAKQGGESVKQYQRGSDEIEEHMAAIHQMAKTGESIIEPMRTKKEVVSWDEVLIKGAQLAKLPLNKEEPVSTKTVIGPNAKVPLVLETPIIVSHMSFGALSKKAKLALAKGSALQKTAIGSGEGGCLAEEMAAAHKYIFEYVPNEYSATPDTLKRADAIELKFGQSVKPGMGGHLPADKVTDEIAKVRGFGPGQDIISPSRFRDIKDTASLKHKVEWLREQSGGKPIGIKLAAGNIEADLEVAIKAGPDFITIDGRPGATGSAAKFIKDSTSVPTLFALYRARKFLDEKKAGNVSLIITGGLRVSSDFAKALALGADAVAIATAALMACACQQYRICHLGGCPVGVTTHNPELTKRLDIETSSQKLANFLKVSTLELKEFARLTGNDSVHKLGIKDLCTTSSEISGHTTIEHV